MASLEPIAWHCPLAIWRIESRALAQSGSLAKLSPIAYEICWTASVDYLVRNGYGS